MKETDCILYDEILLLSMSRVFEADPRRHSRANMLHDTTQNNTQLDGDGAAGIDHDCIIQVLHICSQSTNSLIHYTIHRLG